MYSHNKMKEKYRMNSALKTATKNVKNNMQVDGILWDAIFTLHDKNGLQQTIV